MTIYLLAIAFALLFTATGITYAARQEVRSAAYRPKDRALATDAPLTAPAAHGGDFSALDAGAIEGVCHHV